jgi:hypothetical protein
MISKVSVLRATLTLLAAFAVSAALASAQGYKAASASAAAPAEVADAIRSQLAASAIQVTGPNGALCEIWLRKSLPAAASPASSGAINFGQISLGALVGVIRFDVKSADFRQQAVQPGVYTMRYMLQPVDGNHQGVSTYRDYLLLTPAATDTSIGDVAMDDLVKMSKKASGTGHPSVWSLVPGDGAPASLPGAAHLDDGDLWVVFFQAPLATPATMGLVVVGHAPET